MGNISNFESVGGAMYTVYSIHSGHAGRKTDPIVDFYRWGIGNRGIKKKPENWLSPTSFAPTANVSITFEDGRLVAQLPEVSELRRDNARLWVSHDVFLRQDQKFAPEYLDIEVEDVHQYWRRECLKPPEGADIWLDDPELPASITSGVIYARLGSIYPDGNPPLTVSLEARAGDADKKPNAYLNPLILEVPLDGSRAETRSDLDCRTPESVLDVHPGPGSEDLLRLSVHSKMWQEWAGNATSRVMPAVPRLLFGDRCPKSAVSMFPLLDFLRGTFAIDGVADGGTVKWLWYSTPEVNKHRDLAWLAKRCTGLLGVDLIEEGPAPKQTLPKAVQVYRRHIRDERKAGLTKGDFADNANIEQALQAAEVPRLVRFALNSGNAGKLVREQAVALASDEGFPHFKFVEEIGRDYLLPRSEIVASLPAPPKWLGDADRKIWLDFTAKNALGILSSPLAAAAWWFKLLDTKDPLPSNWSIWIAENGGWWWPYYSALFRRPHNFVPEWEALNGSGVLKAAALGELVLGGSSGTSLGGDINSLLQVNLLAEGRN